MKYLLKREAGFSLVELLIAMTLSTMVMSSLLYLVIESQKSRSALSCFQQTQDIGRSALDMMATRVAASGFRGCGSTLFVDYEYESGLNLSGLLPVERNRIEYDLAITVPVSGYNGSNGNTQLNPPEPMAANTDLSDLAAGLVYDERIPTELKDQQDLYEGEFSLFFDSTTTVQPSKGNVLTTRSVGKRSWMVAGDIAPDQPIPIYADVNGGYPEVGDILFIGDCQRATIFVVTSIADGTVDVEGTSDSVKLLSHGIGSGNIRNASSNLGGSLNMSFRRGAVVASIDVAHFAMGLSQYDRPVVAASDNAKVPALYRAVFPANVDELSSLSYNLKAEEVAPGVIDFEVRFGVSDTPDSAPNQVLRMRDITNAHYLQSADLSVQVGATESCGNTDGSDNSVGWNTFTLRYERFMRLRNVYGYSDR